MTSTEMPSFQHTQIRALLLYIRISSLLSRNNEPLTIWYERLEEAKEKDDFSRAECSTLPCMDTISHHQTEKDQCKDGDYQTRQRKSVWVGLGWERVVGGRVEEGGGRMERPEKKSNNQHNVVDACEGDIPHLPERLLSRITCCEMGVNGIIVRQEASSKIRLVLIKASRRTS